MAKLFFNENTEGDPIRQFKNEMEKLEKSMAEIKGFDHWLGEFSRLKTELAEKRARMDVLRKNLLSTDPVGDPATFKALQQETEETVRAHDALVKATVKAGDEFGDNYETLVASLEETQGASLEMDRTITGQRARVALLQSEIDTMGEITSQDTEAVALKSAKEQELQQEAAVLNEMESTREQAQYSVRALSTEVQGYEAVAGEVSGTEAKANMELERMKNLMSQIGNSDALKKLASDLIGIRGELQKTQTSFETLLGSQEKAHVLMSQMSQMAAWSPFDLQNIMESARQLLEYGVEANEVNDTLLRLGDVASGLSVPLEDMVRLYGEAMTQSGMFGADTSQSMGNNLSVIQELVGWFGKTGEEIGLLVMTGKLGFFEIEQALRRVTEEGGRFYGTMREQSGGLSGQVSTFVNAWGEMFASVSEGAQTMSSDTDAVSSDITANYEKVGEALMGLISEFGTYRSALALNSVAEEGFEGAVRSVVGAVELAIQIQQVYMSVLSMNPYARIAMAVVALATAIWEITQYTSNAVKAQEDMNRSVSEFNAKTATEQVEVDRLFGILRNAKKGTKEYNEAKNEILSKYGSYLEGLGSEVSSLNDVAGAYRAVSEAALKAASARAIASNTQRVQESWGKEDAELTEKLKQRLTGAKGEEYAGMMIARIKRELRELGNISEKTQDELSSLGKVRYLRGRDPYSMIVSKMRDNNQLLQMQYKQIGQNFGVDTNSFSLLTEPQIEENIKVLERARNRIQKSGNSQFLKLFGGAKTFSSEIEIDEYIHSLKKAQDRIKRETSRKEKKEPDKNENKDENKDGDKDGNEGTPKWRFTGSVHAATDDKARLEAENKERSNLLERYSEEQALQVERSQQELGQLNLNLKEEGFEREKANINFQYDQLIAANKQRQQEMLDTLRKTKQLEWEQQHPNARETGETFSYTASFEDLNGKQKDIIRGYEEYAKEYKAKAEADLLDKLLTQYSDYTDKRTEIEKRFNDEIKFLKEEKEKAVNKGDTALAEKLDRSIIKTEGEKKKSTANLDFEALQKEVDWSAVFSSLDEQSSEALEHLKEKLQGFRVSDQGQAMSGENQKSLEDALSKINAQEINNTPFQELGNSLLQLRTAYDAVKTAQENLNIATENGTEAEKAAAKTALDTARVREQEAKKTTTKALQESVKKVKDVADTAAATIGLVEAFGVKVPDGVKELLSGVGETLDGLAEIDLTKPMSVVTGGVKAVTGVVKTVFTLGGLFGGRDRNAERQSELLKELEVMNQYWDGLLNKKKEYMEMKGSATPLESVQAAQDAFVLLDRQKNVFQSIGRTALADGKGHSNSHKMWAGDNKYDTRNWQDVAGEISGARGVKFGSMEDMLYMSPEDLEWIRSNYTGFWGVMEETFRDQLNNLIALKDKTQDIIDTLNRGLTGTNFEELKGNYLSLLQDMDSSTSDFVDDFNAKMRNALLNQLLQNEFAGDISDLYEKWVGVMKNKATGTKTDEEVAGLAAGLQEDNRKLGEDMIRRREEMMALYGLDPVEDTSQAESTQKGFAAMSQDTGDELNGRFTALQIAGEEIRNQNILQSEALNVLNVKADTLLAVNTGIYNIADEMRTFQVNSYQELQTIRENTGAIIKPIKDMQSDIAEIKNNIKNI